MRPAWLLAAALGASLAARGVAQEPLPLSRADAIRSALERGARLAVSRADTAVASAQLRTARTFQNPVLAASYSRSVPQYHLIAELPLDAPWLRSVRIHSAQAARAAAQYRFAYDRAAVALEVDTTYTRALAALARVRLSRHNAADADSLRRMAIARREAGDASDLDVELATVSAGQQANAAAADSLVLAATLLDLQTVIGLSAAQVTIVPTDSLTAPPGDVAAAGAGTTLTVAAAEAALESAELAARLRRRSVLPVPAVTFGFEQGDPSGAEPGILPTFGVAIALPLFNRNGGAIQQAEAERDRAWAELELARLTSLARISAARRAREIALARVERDVRLVESANRVAAMSLRAYREGAVSLPNVLEAQRNAREILSQYVDDLGSVWIVTAALRVFTLPAEPAEPR